MLEGDFNNVLDIFYLHHSIEKSELMQKKKSFLCLKSNIHFVSIFSDVVEDILPVIRISYIFMSENSI